MNGWMNEMWGMMYNYIHPPHGTRRFSPSSRQGGEGEEAVHQGMSPLVGLWY